MLLDQEKLAPYLSSSFSSKTVFLVGSTLLHALKEAGATEDDLRETYTRIDTELKTKNHTAISSSIPKVHTAYPFDEEFRFCLMPDSKQPDGLYLAIFSLRPHLNEYKEQVLSYRRLNTIQLKTIPTMH